MSSMLRPPVDRRDHYRGDLHAPVKLVEFGDYQCPFCGRAYPIVRALEAAFGNQLCMVYRHFPLADVHPHAVLAAEAAEAAGAQDAFWEMHDLLFTRQHALDLPDLRQYASQLELDLDQFDQDLRTHRHADKLRADVHSGALSGVNGTPSFFINGQRHDGSYDFDTMTRVIAGQIAGYQAVP
jgi:protein-disulfide isomerase